MEQPADRKALVTSILTQTPYRRAAPDDPGVELITYVDGEPVGLVRSGEMQVVLSPEDAA